MRRGLVVFALLLATATPAWATFPTIVSVAVGADTGDTTNHVVTLPASISSGNRLLLAIACRDATNTVSFAATGFTQLTQQKSSDTTSTGSILATAYKSADGTESSSTVTVTTSGGNARPCAWRVWNFSGAHAATIPEAATVGGAASVNPNPPSLTPSFLSVDAIYIVVEGNSVATTTSAYPTNYGTGQVTQATSGGTTNSTIAAASRELNTGSAEDPGTFTISLSNPWAAATIAVPPAAAGGGGPLGGGIGHGGVIQ